MMLQGVNLGGWLVLEKWMTPSLFDGTTAADETYFCHDLGEDRARERLKTFRDTFIQRRDLRRLPITDSTRCAFRCRSSSLRILDRTFTAMNIWIERLNGRKNFS